MRADADKKVVYADATIALPPLIHGLIDEGVKRVNPPDFSWIFPKSVREGERNE